MDRSKNSHKPYAVNNLQNNKSSNSLMQHTVKMVGKNQQRIQYNPKMIANIQRQNAKSMHNHVPNSGRLNSHDNKNSMNYKIMQDPLVLRAVEDLIRKKIIA